MSFKKEKKIQRTVFCNGTLSKDNVGPENNTKQEKQHKYVTIKRYIKLMLISQKIDCKIHIDPHTLVNN